MATVLKPSSELTELQELPTKKRGRSLLIGEELYRQVQVYLDAIQERGGVVNMVIAIAVGNGVIMNDQRFMASGGENVFYPEIRRSMYCITWVWLNVG